MEYIWCVVVFIFGAIIGSFLNVVLYRLHTGKSLNGRSHCMSCGKTLTWKELFPLFSYVFQKGRCTACSAHIPSRYFIVELLTGVAFLTIYILFWPHWILTALYAILLSVLILIVVYDIRHTIIPDELVVLTGGVALLLLGIEYWEVREIIHTLWSIGAGAFAAFFFWGLWFVSNGRWIGLGDAKLALPLGVVVGIGGVFSMVVLSFWIGAVISLSLLGINHLANQGKTRLRFPFAPRTIKSEVPFAPFLVLGFILVQLFHADIFQITYKVFFSW